jgi:hypothetical protein
MQRYFSDVYLALRTSLVRSLLFFITIAKHVQAPRTPLEEVMNPFRKYLETRKSPMAADLISSVVPQWRAPD